MVVDALIIAAPVTISIPDSAPAAKTRAMAGTISLIPPNIASKVAGRVQPASNPPETAPSIRLKMGRILQIKCCAMRLYIIFNALAKA